MKRKQSDLVDEAVIDRERGAIRRGLDDQPRVSREQLGEHARLIG